MTERWVTAVNTDGRYEVSDLGRVRRAVPGGGARVGRVLRPRIRAGYVRAALWSSGRCRDVSVHRLVLESFVPRPDDPAVNQVNHKNGVRNDNRLENLEWVTRLQNVHHAHATGLVGSTAGERNGRAKVTWEQVRQIRAMTGKDREIGALFGISDKTVQQIQSGAHWYEKELVR